MNLFLFDDDAIITFNLPDKKLGNYWMTDNSGNNVVNIDGTGETWLLSGSDKAKLVTDDGSETIVLSEKSYYKVSRNEKEYILYCDKAIDETFVTYQVAEGGVYKFGNNPSNEIYAVCNYILDPHYTISLEQGRWKLQKAENALLYVNNNIVNDEVTFLRHGDIINAYGIIVVLANGIIAVNNPNNNVSIPTLQRKDFIINAEVSDEEIINENMYNDNDYFLKSPRMRRTIETLEMNIDSPPAKENMQETPLIMTLAPMLTMAASSMISLSQTLQSMTGENAKTLKETWPTLLISVLMIFSMFVWPFVTKKYEKNQKLKREKERQDKYKSYLDTKKAELSKEYDTQKRILEEGLLATNVCYDTILNRRRTLWERKIDQEDFLTVRVGKGQKKLDANIGYQSEDFKMDDDDLKKMLEGLIKGYEMINDVPVGYSFADNKLTTINGVYPKYINFMKNILLQMMAFHSYDDLKIVVFTNKKNQSRWSFLKSSPYCFSNDKQIRFFATNTEEMQEISNYLDPLFGNRQTLASNGNNDERVKDYSKFNGYYLVIIDDIDLARKISIVDDILSEKRNMGFSLIVVEEKLSKVPSEINRFITIGDSASVILNSEENNDQVRFTDEVSDQYDMFAVTKTLSNVPLYMEQAAKQLPDMITFLELFGVGQIEQLNVLNRWKENDPVRSLKSEIGVNENGDPFILDLHEKQHGPHGLVAGMTGSGKSEFIITYVLSMAVNYSPEEVAFVLIDYKGGGLAGAFVNSETGQKLPHVVGTITNLDKAEINRALSSIQSELRRRQAKFNEVRDKMGESTIDIYKYQKLYREGAIDEPIPHLVIVCDEFAELKDQQPDFMEDLISAARIGRSLGVHLILATQKPSGVVDAQIWSNSKFKICLKVQDKSDSMEMIKCDLAAELKNVGRFYLQVGYNEFFAMGQSAWAGAQYYPSKEYKKAVDKNMYVIDNIGSVVKSIKNMGAKKSTQSEGEELTSIVKYLISMCADTPYKIRQLWLDRIPNIILIQELFKKYNWAKEKFVINPIIGEYDDPSNQSQGLLTLNISGEGNTVLYGTSDSGKDEYLASLVYSMISTYDTNELNLYLCDFGAETLMNFANAPQVGNVILNGDDEKLENMAKMLVSEMNKRKKAFMSYNGNYQDYIKLSGKTLPNIVVIINSIEVLTEVYQDYIDKLMPAIREGSKYGINFIITTASQNTIRFKVAQCCKQQICLQLNSDNEYRDILGKTEGLVPFACLGRGLIKLDRVVEFQTASITSESSSFNAIKELVDLLNTKGFEKARAIPVMPDIIELDLFRSKFEDLSSVPIGLTKESLNASLFDFSKNVMNIISSNEMETTRRFMLNLLKLFEMNDTFNKVVVDACNYFEEFNYKINLIDKDFNKVIDQLKQVDDQVQKIYVDNNMNPKALKGIANSVVVVFGIDKFMSKLDDEHKNIFKEILTNNKETLKINFIFIDIPGSFKKFEYDDWFKTSVNSNEGIWIGGGVTQQYLLKTTVQPSSISNIDNEFGVSIKAGVPTVVKLINEIKQ